MTAVKSIKSVDPDGAAPASVSVMIARAAACYADHPQKAAGLLLAAARQAVRAVAPDEEVKDAVCRLSRARGNGDLESTYGSLETFAEVCGDYGDCRVMWELQFDILGDLLEMLAVDDA